MMARPVSTPRAKQPLEGGENTVAQIEQVLSLTRAEIERSEKLVKLIKAARKKSMKKTSR